MKVKTQVVIVLAMIAGLLATTASAGAQEKPDSPEEFNKVLIEETGFSVEEWVGAWGVTRERFGFSKLSADEIEDLAYSPQGQQSYVDHGMPLTDREEAEMSRRNEIISRMESISEKASAMKGFAGIEFDHQANVGVIFSAGELKAEDRASLLSAMSDKNDLRFDSSAKFSLEALNETMKAIESSWSYEGVPIRAIGIDTERNQIVVTVEENVVPRLPASLRRDIDTGVEQSGEIAVQVGTIDPMNCTNRRNCDSPLRGAIREQNRDRSNKNCTTGFVMEDSVGNVFVTSAAHCGEDGDDRRIGDRTSGSGVNYEQHSQHNPSDSALIGIDLNQASTFVYFRKAERAKVITNVQDFSVNNTPGCLLGIKVGRSCNGLITNVNAGSYNLDESGPAPTFTVNDSFRFVITLPGNWGCGPGGGVSRWIEGNSGGPFTSTDGSWARGTLSGCAPASVNYDAATDSTTLALRGTQISDIQAGLGAQVRTG